MKLDYLVACFRSYHNVALTVGIVLLRKSYCMSVCMSVLLLLNTLDIDLLCDTKFKMETAQKTVCPILRLR